MSIAIIITFCSLLLIAYIFDLTSLHTRVPSVILLLLLGWVSRQIVDLLQINIPDLTPLLPILGTIGLILIVLEGSLELELNASKIKHIRKSFIVSVIPLFAVAFLFAYVLAYFGSSLQLGLVNAIPLCIISSAIAIPSVKHLGASEKEFVIYESSLSDIVGVLFFNFVALNEIITGQTFVNFGLAIGVIAIVSFVATVGLALLLSKIQHPIKFGPIVLLIVLIYSVSKYYHLPSLIFILFFGLCLGNLDELKRFAWIGKLSPDILSKEVLKFREITAEATFLIRALFFILFGYLMKTSEIIDPKTFIWSAGLVATIFIIRAIVLKVSRVPLMPLLFIAPRGLISILLFLSIGVHQAIPLVNNSLVVQVIILTVVVMMLGLMLTKNETTKEIERLKNNKSITQDQV